MTGAQGGKPVVLLFDGECGFCQWSVRFVVRRDLEGVFRYAPLASPQGRALLAAAGTPDPGSGGAGPSGPEETVVLVDQDRVHLRSDAVVEVLRRLPRWRLVAALLRWVPRPLRDAGYRGVARIRRRLFPPPLACPLPDPELRARLRRP